MSRICSLKQHPFIISQCYGSGIQCGLTGSLWFRVPHKAEIKVLAGVAFTSRLDWGESSSKPTHVAVGKIQFLKGWWTESINISQAVDREHRFLVKWVSPTQKGNLFLLVCGLG